MFFDCTSNFIRLFNNQKFVTIIGNIINLEMFLNVNYNCNLVNIRF